MIAGQFLVYSGPTVLLLMDGKEVYRASGFINLEEEEVDTLINQFPVPADYDGVGSKGTKFVFYM